LGTPQQAQAAHAHAISTHTHAITAKGTDLADETFDGDEGHVRVHGIRTCHAQPLSRSLTDTHAPLAHNAAACACFESHGNTQQQAHTVAGHDAEVVHLAWFAALDHQTCVSFRHPYAHTWLARARQIPSRAAALSGDCRLLAPSQAASADKRTLGWQPHTHSQHKQRQQHKRPITDAGALEGADKVVMHATAGKHLCARARTHTCVTTARHGQLSQALEMRQCPTGSGTRSTHQHARYVEHARLLRNSPPPGTARAEKAHLPRESGPSQARWRGRRG
jgi:hypothetical protein